MEQSFFSNKDIQRSKMKWYHYLLIAHLPLQYEIINNYKVKFKKTKDAKVFILGIEKLC